MTGQATRRSTKYEVQRAKGEGRRAKGEGRRAKSGVGSLAFAWLLLFAATSWAGNRADMFALDPGNRNNAFDDLDLVVHTRIPDHLKPWPLYLYIGPDGYAVDQFFVGLRTDQVLFALRKAAESWNDVKISSFKFGSPIPFTHNMAKFPNQFVIPGASGLDGWNIVTFLDPMYTAPQGVVSQTMRWVFWQPYDLKSFISLPPGVVAVNPPGPNPPGGGIGQLVQIDFDMDGYPDVIIPAREYAAGETIEADMWFSQIQAWRHWPQDPNDLATTFGATTRIDTLGTLDVQALVTHEMGHLMGLAHSDIEKATMYYTINGPYTAGFQFPTDVWEMRSLSLDDEISAALLYPKSNASRGAIAGRVLDGRNFDGQPDYTTGVIDAVLYGTLWLTREMTSPTIPAFEPDKFPNPSITTTGISQRDLDTSPALWLEALATVQTGDNITIALFPNPKCFEIPSGPLPALTTAIVTATHIEASPYYLFPGVPPFDRYIIRLDDLRVYRNDNAGVATNISPPFNFFDGYQTIPTDYYGGNVNLASMQIVGADSPLPLGTVTTVPLVRTGDDTTSFTYVAVRAGEITSGIDIYTNTGGLPPGVTPTPLPGITPTPAPVGATTFTPDSQNDYLLPQSNAWGAAAAAGDVDNDGDIDLYICNSMASGGGGGYTMINRLYINTLWEPGANPPTTRVPGRRTTDGRPYFEDRTYGPDRLPATSDDRLPIHLDSSFYAKMADFNNDGFLDVFVCNTATRDNPSYAQNRLLINRGGTNRAQAGYFDDWTTKTRTDAGIGIPLAFSRYVLPG
ncbi:matrixin family metalloprotease, partial [Candidatus Sumerlaeota bacterium]|nr:matrixin family metalloprotease [Candidatus Sumerlaeota bacterium]